MADPIDVIPAADTVPADTDPAHPLDTDPAFYFDLGSPEAYLAAERILTTLPVACAWVPVRAAELGPAAPVDRDAIAARAAELGLQPMAWPATVPFDSDLAQRAATYARGIGRVVAFSLAAFRQAYAGARDLSVPDHVLIAGAACEMHPTALLRGCETRGTRRALDEATAQARARGVRSVPAVWTGTEVVHGEHGLDRAAELLAGVRA